jgi:hypothetical protein
VLTKHDITRAAIYAHNTLSSNATFAELRDVALEHLPSYPADHELSEVEVALNNAISKLIISEWKDYHNEDQ